jgi:hypothetical protein
MISEDDIEKALTYLRESVDKASSAKQQMVVTEQWIKTTKAELMAGMAGMSVSAAEVQALADPRYKQAVEAYGEAVKAFSWHQMKRETALAWIEAWRSQEASNRAMDRSHR